MLVFIKNKNETNSDAYKFKSEYAELNNKNNETTGKTYPIVDLNDKNPFVYASEDDIKSLLDSGKFFCRKVLLLAVYIDAAGCLIDF